MTQASFVASRSGGFAETERTVPGLIASLRSALDDRRTFRRTLAELRSLSPRQREDLGFAGLDLADVAHAALRRTRTTCLRDRGSRRPDTMKD